MKLIWKFSLIVPILIIIGFFGPKVKYNDVVFFDSSLDLEGKELERYVIERESKLTDLKSGNAAKIVWADSTQKNKTEYVLLYVHGFSASHQEGFPIHVDFAKRYGLNLYLTRLEDHGRSDRNTFKNLTPDNYIQSVEDAFDIAKQLGQKVIVMSCSTGSTIAAILDAKGEEVYGHIMYSPNIDIADPNSNLLLFPWGEQMAQLVMKGNYKHNVYDTMQQKYWNDVYHINGLFVVKSLIKEYMIQPIFEKIESPVFLGYYYKDEKNQDNVVSVSRMLDFFEQISTPKDLKRIVNFTEAGSHMLCSELFSKQLEDIQKETYLFAEQVLGLQSI